MSLFRDDGSYIPWGSLERVRTESFISELTLPSWFSIYDNAGGAGTFALGSPKTSVQGLRIDSPATLGSFVAMNINDNLPVSSAGGTFRNDLMEIRLGISGLTFSHSEADMDFGINILSGNATGARVGCTVDGTYFEGRPGGTASRKFFPYQILQGGEFAKPRNIEFITRPDRWVLLRENGYVVAYHRFSAAEMVLGEVQPKPVIFSRGSGGVRSMFMSKFSFTLCH